MKDNKENRPVVASFFYENKCFNGISGIKGFACEALG